MLVIRFVQNLAYLALLAVKMFLMFWRGSGTLSCPFFTHVFKNQKHVSRPFPRSAAGSLEAQQPSRFELRLAKEFTEKEKAGGIGYGDYDHLNERWKDLMKK